MTTETYNHLEAVHPKTAAEWREWLAQNHDQKDAVWVIFYHKKSGVPTITYNEAVDEALCFGWIDSKPNKRDHESSYRYFSKRNPKSKWSKVNKAKIERLMKENKLAPAGLEMVKLAKKSGTWTALDKVEDLVVPKDLQQAFDQNPVAFDNWKSFPPSSKKIILEWIYSAKLEETRKKRIDETIEKAAQNIRANHYRQ